MKSMPIVSSWLILHNSALALRKILQALRKILQALQKFLQALQKFLQALRKNAESPCGFGHYCVVNKAVQQKNETQNAKFVIVSRFFVFLLRHNPLRDHMSFF